MARTVGVLCARGGPWSRAVLCAALVACGSGAPEGATLDDPEQAGVAATTAGVEEPADRQQRDEGSPEDPALPVVPPVAPRDVAADAPADHCAVAHLGLDLRALPTRTSPSGVDMFVLGQADHLRELAGAPPLRVGHIPGTGVLYAYFDAATPAAALSRCERSVAQYLAAAPRLPVTMEPGAQLIDTCRACDPPPAHTP